MRAPARLEETSANVTEVAGRWRSSRVYRMYRILGLKVRVQDRSGRVAAIDSLSLADHFRTVVACPCFCVFVSLPPQFS